MHTPSTDLCEDNETTSIQHRRPKKLRRLRQFSDSSLDESVTVVAFDAVSTSSSRQVSSSHDSLGGRKSLKRTECSAPSLKGSSLKKNKQLTADFQLSRYPSTRSSSSRRISVSKAATECFSPRENPNPFFEKSPSPIWSDDDNSIEHHEGKPKKRFCDFEIKLVDCRSDSDATSPRPVVNQNDCGRPIESKQKDESKKRFTFRRMDNRMFGTCNHRVEPSLLPVEKTSQVVEKWPNRVENLVEIDRTCILVSNESVGFDLSVNTRKTPDRCKRTMEAFVDDIDISGMSTSWLDDQISPCILSQTSVPVGDSRRADDNRDSQMKENKNMTYSAKARKSNRISLIETTPDIHTKCCTTAKESKKSLLQVETTPVKKDASSFRIETSPLTKSPEVYTFRNFKRKFRHYSPSVKHPLISISNLSTNSHIIYPTP